MQTERGGQRRIGRLEGSALLRRPEVELLDPQLPDRNVGRLQIAASESFLQGRVQGVKNLASILDGCCHRQRSLKGSPFDVLHDQLVRPDVVQVADVGLVQCPDGPRLAPEALAMRSSRVCARAPTTHIGLNPEESSDKDCSWVF